MKYWLAFCGYPRSGHTVVASILNANPNVICTNQLHLFDKLDVDFSEYMKDAPQGWKVNVPQVPKQEITVMGDKTGHRTTELLGKNPQRLGEMKAKVSVPIKWIHVVRNPFDNIATWARLDCEMKQKKNIPFTHKAELDEKLNEYIYLNQVIDKLKRSEDILTVKHEYVITRMHNTLEEIANFLEISFDPIWRDNVRNTVWKKPRTTRRTIPWTQKQKGKIHDIIDQYEWLKGYDFGGCGRC
jgi:hypothetical protein